jgi:uncharacterized protein with FMN-binding domain
MIKVKRFLKIVLGIFIVLVVIVTGGIAFISSGLKSGSKITVSNVNLSSVKDGIYDGKYRAGRWSNEVKVTVKDHKITQIDVVKDVLIPDPKVTKEILSRVIENQDTTIDTISGATVTSKAYLKSIETALNN